MGKPPRSGTIAFKPRARLLKLIGEELISDDVVAVSELVKNAHDADALTVTISFHGVTGEGGKIEVRDDGCGMDAETLLGRWMQPAASTKVGTDRARTPRGRRVLGEKGVGRFAADKLARHLEIVSRCDENPDEVRAVVDWDQFDNDELMLDEVQNRWELRPAQLIQQHGTVLLMTTLRTVWTERMFRRLSIRLGRLLSPFRAKDKFTIRIDSDEFPQYSGELRSDILEKAPYRIEAFFDGNQTVTFSTNRTVRVQQRWNGHGELTCGAIRIRLYVFDLDGEALARVGPRMEVRAWLKEWTGVSIYRDGFRIWPYGEPHDDWLRLDQRRVNNPVEHLSNNQVIGFIDISRDGNPELMDQTNREGLMNNRAFEDLRRLVSFVFQIIEAERQTVRHPQQLPLPSTNGQKEDVPSTRTELAQIAAQAPEEIGKQLEQLSERLEEQQTRDRKRESDLVEGYIWLATLGQTTTNLAQILPEDVRGLQENLKSLRRALGATNVPVTELIGKLSSISERLSWQARMLQLAVGETERRRAIDVIAECEDFRNSVDSLLQKHGVRLEIEQPEREVLRTEMRPEQFHCLLHILLTNSLDWLADAQDKRIRVILTSNGDFCDLVFNDSGPGIPFGLSWRVFEPGFTTREHGRGMGLTLAQHLVESYGGRIEVIQDGRRRGANIHVLLPRKRSRATFYNGQTGG